MGGVFFDFCYNSCSSPCLSFDLCAGTEPYQNAESFRQLINLLPRGMKSKRTSLLDFQMEKIEPAIDWKLNTVLEKVEKILGSFFTELREW